MNANEGGGADLLAPLREMDIDESPPPGYDVAAAMRRGTTIRRRRVTTGVIAVAVLGAVAGSAILRQAHTTPSPVGVGSTALPLAGCTGRVMTAPAGTGAYTSVVGAVIDPTGRYLALTVARPDVPHLGAIHAMLVDRRTDTTTMIPLDNASAVAVNSSGAVTGWTDSPLMSAWVYDGQRVVALPSFAGRAVTPTAINARGDVVGYATSNDTAGTSTAVIWPAGSPREVRALDGSGSMAFGIGDDGTVVGSRDVYGVSAPTVWDAAGSPRLLPTGDVVHQGEARAVAGHYATGDNVNGRAAVWDLATGALRQYPSIYAFLWVSPDGTAIGGVQGPNSMTGAVIARDGQVMRLPDVDRLDGQTATGASDDAKTIVGAAFSDSGSEQYALMWTC